MKSFAAQPLRLSQRVTLFSGTLFLAVIYIDWSLGWNIVSRMAMPLSLALEGSWSIDLYAPFTGDKATIDGRYFSDKGPLPGLLMLPFIFLLDLIIDLSSYPPEKQLLFSNALGGILLGSLPFALSLMRVRKLLPSKFPTWLVILFFFGSFLFAFSGSAFSHVFTGYLILLSFYFLQKHKVFVAGIFLGAAFCSEYSTAIFGIFWAGYLISRSQYKSIINLIIGTLPFLLFQAWYNWQITGDALVFAYKFQENFSMNAQYYGFRWPSLEALWHLSFSSYRGMFFYAPLLLVLLFTPGRKWWPPQWQSPWLWAGLAALGYLLLFSMSRSWYGGWTFGPRYLYPATLLLFVALAQKTSFPKWQHWSLMTLGVLGLAHSILNKATVLYPQSDVSFPAGETMIPALLEGRFNQMNLFSAMGLPHYIAVIVLSLGISALLIWSCSIQKLKKSIAD